MPRLSQWYIRCSIFYLLAGSLIGALLLLSKEYESLIIVYQWRFVHVYWMLFGWLLQLAIGSAWWIFPRLFTKEKYGNMKMGWLGFTLINLALLAQLFLPLFNWILLPGALLILIGIAIQALTLWRRVISYNTA